MTRASSSILEWHKKRNPSRSKLTRVQLLKIPNLNRPGGNITGVTQLNIEVGPKRLEVAHELMPTATAMAFLLNPNDAPRAETQLRDVQAAAVSLGLRLHILRAVTDAEIEAAFAGFAALKAGILVIGADALFNSKSRLLAELSPRYAVPSIYENREFTHAAA
jgi:putative ABC transport system substrate-binding protein